MTNMGKGELNESCLQNMIKSASYLWKFDTFVTVI